MKRRWTAYQGGVQRAGVLRGVGRGGSLGEHEVLLDEEDRVVVLVDRDPVALPPVQVVEFHVHLENKEDEAG